MNICLVCLGHIANKGKNIRVGETKWRSFSINKVIDKYLWPLNYVKGSWLCTPCWEELYSFHLFHSRVEKIHGIKNHQTTNSKATACHEPVEHLNESLESEHVSDKGESRTGPSKAAAKDSLPMPAAKTSSNALAATAKPLLMMSVSRERPPDGKRRKAVAAAINIVPSDVASPTMVGSAVKGQQKPAPNPNPLVMVTVNANLLADVNLGPETAVTTETAPTTKLSPDTAASAKNPPRSRRSKAGQEAIKSPAAAGKRHSDASLNSSASKRPKTSCLIQSEEVIVKVEPDFVLKQEDFDEMEEDETQNQAMAEEGGSLDEGPENLTQKLEAERKRQWLAIAPEKIPNQDEFLRINTKICCGICNERFKTFNLMCKHSMEAHERPGFVTCCQLKFNQRCRLADHVMTHFNPKYFKCKICNKVSRDRSCLHSHWRKHTDAVPYCCTVCNESFHVKSKLDAHRWSHASRDQLKFGCRKCTRKFGTAALLKIHERESHLKKKCHICGETLEHYEHKHHMKTHKIGFTCEICSKPSTSEKGLKNHMFNFHKEVTKYQCTQCDKEFTTNVGLKAHMDTHEEKEKEI